MGVIPILILGILLYSKFSPHEWGWSWLYLDVAWQRPIFPTWVGVILNEFHSFSVQTKSFSVQNLIKLHRKGFKIIIPIFPTWVGVILILMWYWIFKKSYPHHEWGCGRHMTAVFLCNKSTTVMHFIGFYSCSFSVKSRVRDYSYL